MDEKSILDSILLPLADQFESGNRHWVTLEPASAQEYEPLRKCIAGLIAEDSLSKAEGISGAYRLTKTGYAKYAPRIAALRTL